jgi:hypothetical protein
MAAPDVMELLLLLLVVPVVVVLGKDILIGKKKSFAVVSSHFLGSTAQKLWCMSFDRVGG